MPYGDISELPIQIRSTLPEEAQEIYREAYNYAYDTTCNGTDSCSDIVAWSQVRRFFMRDDDGWHKRSPISSEEILSTNEVILNTLDRPVDGLYFGQEHFASTQDWWDGIPLIFADEHPDLATFAREPEMAVGTIVGEFKRPRVEQIGHPTFRGDFVFSGAVPGGDPDVAKKAVDLLNEGRLSHSSAFISPESDGELAAPVLPNHILVFEESLRDHRLPRDKGTAILNMEPGDTVTNEHTNIGKKMSSANEAKLAKIYADLKAFVLSISGEKPDEKEDETEQQKEQKNQEDNSMADETLAETISQLNQDKAALTASLAEKDTEIDGLKTQVESLTGQITEFKNMQEQQMKEAADQKWSEAKKLLPIGVTNTEEKDAEARTLYETDKDAFYLKVMEHKNQEEQDGAEGSEYPGHKNSEDGERDPELIEAEAEWEMI